MSEWRKSGLEARTLLALAWPISVAQLALMLLNLVDTAVVGRHSVEALAGASLGRNIAWPAQSLPQQRFAASALPLTATASFLRAVFCALRGVRVSTGPCPR